VVIPPSAVFTVTPITDFADPRLAPFRNLKAQVDHLNQGVFVAEGEKVIRRLLASPHRVVSVLVPPECVTGYEPLLAARAETITLFVAGRDVLRSLTGFSIFQGQLALAQVPRAATMDELLSLPRPHLFAAIDGLSNAENVGAVIRNAAALGVQAIIVGETSGHAYLRRSVRSSMGTIFQLPYLACAARSVGIPAAGTDLATTLTQLRAHGVRCLAAHPHTDRRTLWDADLTGDRCIVLGSEGDGLRPEVLAACDEAVAIPMCESVDSLNVASAAAIFFAEAQRQRISREVR
jgi:tRNA G18 (ribose-2'-O)-methylase SpoU